MEASDSWLIKINKEIKMDVPATPLTLSASMLECIK